jgi:hypothetical protein
VLLPWRVWKLRTMDLISNSIHSLQNMQVSKRGLWYGSAPRRWPLPVGTHTGFYRWLLRRYRWSSNRVLGFPVLVFLRPFRPAVPREPKNSIMYMLHLTLVTPALQSQLVLRDRLRHQTWLSPQRPWRPTQRISTATTPWWPMTAADDFRTRPLAQRESGAWLNAPRPWRLPLPEHALMVRSITYQQTQTAVNTVRVVQPELWRFLGTTQNWIERFERSTGHTHIPKMQRPTAFPALLPTTGTLPKPARLTRPVQPEVDTSYFASPISIQSLPTTSRVSSQARFHLYKAQRSTTFPALLPAASTLSTAPIFPQSGQSEAGTGFTPQAQRPVDLSYVLPAVSTVARPEQRQEAADLFAPPIGWQSVPTPSQVPGIDVNRLTEQVVQALERKIRLEKQRRGYR